MRRLAGLVVGLGTAHNALCCTHEPHHGRLDGLALVVADVAVLQRLAQHLEGIGALLNDRRAADPQVAQHRGIDERELEQASPLPLIALMKA